MYSLLTISNYAAAQPGSKVPMPGLFKLNPTLETATLLQPMSLGECAYQLYGDYEFWKTHLIPFNRYALQGKNGLSSLDTGFEAHFSTPDLVASRQNQVVSIQQYLASYNKDKNTLPYLEAAHRDLACEGTEAGFVLKWNPKTSLHTDPTVYWRVVYDPGSDKGISRRYKSSSSSTENKGRTFKFEAEALGAHTIECIVYSGDNRYRQSIKQMVITAEEWAIILSQRTGRTTPVSIIVQELSKRTPKSKYKPRIDKIKEKVAEANNYPLLPIPAMYFSTDDESKSFDLALFLAPENLETEDDQGTKLSVTLTIYDFSFADIRGYSGTGATIDQALETAIADYGSNAPIPEGKVIIQIEEGSLPFGVFTPKAYTINVDNFWSWSQWLGYASTATMVIGLTAGVAGQAEISLPCLYLSGSLGGLSAGVQIGDRIIHDSFEWDIKTGLDLLDIAGAILALGAVKRISQLIDKMGKATLVGRITVGTDVFQIIVIGEQHRRKISIAADGKNESEVFMAVIEALQEGAFLIVVKKASSHIQDQAMLQLVNQRSMVGRGGGPPRQLASANPPLDPATAAHDQRVAQMEVGPITNPSSFSGASTVNVPEGDHIFRRADTLDDAYIAYEEALHAVSDHREVAIFRNRLNGQFQVVVGTEVSVGVFRKGRAEIDAWEGVLHFHPGSDDVSIFRLPSVNDLYLLMVTNYGRVRRNFIEYPVPGGGRGRTGYEIDGDTGHILISYSDGTSTKEMKFNNLGKYDEYRLARTVYIDPETIPQADGTQTHSELYRELMWEAADRFGHKLPFERPPTGFRQPMAGSTKVPTTAEIAQLKARAKDDPDAVWALIDLYRSLPRKHLVTLAKTDPAAASVLEARPLPNRPLDRIRRRQGPFSEPTRFFQLADRIQQYRRAVLISRRGRTAVAPDDPVKGGTVGAGSSNIEGLETPLTGASRNAGGEFYHESIFKPAAEFDSSNGPAMHGHAEQQLADQYHVMLKDMDPSQYKGKTIWMLIEQEPCSSCRQGLRNPDVEPGVLAKFSEQYPEITIEVRNLNDSSLEVIKAGRSTNN